MTIAAGLAKKPEMMDAFRQAYGQNIGGRWWYSIIPLMPAVREEVVVPPRENFKTTTDRLEQVADAATRRLETVVNAFANQPGDEHKGWSVLFKLVFDLGGADKIRSLILNSLTAELRNVDQV